MEAKKWSKLLQLCVSAIVIICIGAVSAAWAQPNNVQGRQMVEQLYTPNGVMPIRDLVVELECYNFSSETNSFALGSKDKIYYKYPNKLRIDSVINDPGGPMDQKEAIIIRDGVNAWHYISMGQYPVKKALDLPSGNLNLPFNIQKYPIDANKNYTIKGKKTIAGVETVEIFIENPQDETDNKTVYIDTKRQVPLRLDALRISDKEKILVRVDYSDIEKLQDGRYFPKKIDIFENDVHKKMRVYKGIQANCGLDDSMFDQMKGFVNQ